MTEAHLARRNAAPAVIVLAKSPEPGRAKTRCSPPCSPRQAADLARAAIVDTLAVVCQVPASRRIVVLEGEPGNWLPPGFEVIAQRTGTLGERIDGAFADVGQPAILVGMDTPQMDSMVLTEAIRWMAEQPAEAVVGPADDGGFWAVGLSAPPPGLFASVPMSREDTCRSLLAALVGHAITCRALPFLSDFDDFDTARAIARTVPGSRFAAAVSRIEQAIEAGVSRGASQ